MNRVLEQLGYGPDDRVVIVHADDIGMCQATLLAFAGLLDAGLVSSGAVMVPCPWFPSAAAFCREHPDVDVGIHLTLTCEWTTYRWGPVSTRDPASGLLDEEGYLPRSTQEIERRGVPEAVAFELRAQVDRAVRAGIDPTHVDTHMGSLAHPKFIDAYTGIAVEQRLPSMLFRIDAAGARAHGADEATAASLAQKARQLDEQGLVLFDDLVGMPLSEPGDRIAIAKQKFDSLRPGLTMFLLHPAVDTPELRAIAPDWRSRVADYEAFSSSELRDYVRDAGIHVIGYRILRDLIRDRQH
ncbi:MAG TPA: polysaccharide deacetylase family protein [Herpetosiphonaceae bacterium]|nr:polysaccharide deacetylase family protein [Herpetosiphonaceae bacterium]